LPTFQSEYLRELIKKIFIKCTVPDDEAAIVADNLVESSLMGLGSHGILRVSQYVEAILDGTKDGCIKAGGKLTIVKDKGATVLVDCGRNFGQVGGLRAIELAIERAGKHGISCVLAKNCNHAGRLGAFTQYAADNGMIAIATCNSPKHGHWVAPFGGRQGRLATNPLSFAAPSSGNPIVLDMSTSAISEGMVRMCFNKSQDVPQNCISDGQGSPTTDPKKFYAQPKGTINPFGGQAGYKGMGLAIMVEILSGTLKGDLITDESIIGNGLCFIVIDPGSFVTTERFKTLTDALVDYIKSSPPAEGCKGVVMPGELDFMTKRTKEKQGIEVDENTWNQVTDIAKKLGITI
jgi:uncharacterized oxidoreductase